jgi:hypothetical protein
MAKSCSGIFDVNESVMSRGIGLDENHLAASTCVHRTQDRLYIPLSSGKSLSCSKIDSQMSISGISRGG